MEAGAGGRALPDAMSNIMDGEVLGVHGSWMPIGKGLSTKSASLLYQVLKKDIDVIRVKESGMVPLRAYTMLEDGRDEKILWMR
jgi:hypothetical protein